MVDMVFDNDTGFRVYVRRRRYHRASRNTIRDTWMCTRQSRKKKPEKRYARYSEEGDATYIRS